MADKPGLVLVDPVGQKSYSFASLNRSGLGGTEATVLRVCKGLKPNFCITVLQRSRKQPRWEQGVYFAPLNLRQPEGQGMGKFVIVVRGDQVLSAIRRAWPDAALFLWLHCFPGRHKRRLGECCQANDAQVVCVSDTLRQHLLQFCCGALPEWRTHVVHNVVADSVRFIHRSVDPDKLVFLSSPHKGLDQVLDNFAAVRRVLPHMRLVVANPGYLHWPVSKVPDGVRFLGDLDHRRALEELASSLCLFNPQSRFAETFGLVFAEAHALGTPVLTHPLGAAREVVADSEQLVDANDPQAIIATLRRWRAGGRPKVMPDPRFNQTRIMASWRRLLSGSTPGRTNRAVQRANCSAPNSGGVH